LPKSGGVSLAQHEHAARDKQAIKMKRLFRIFELSKNEQRVVLIAVFILIVFAFARYEQRAWQRPVQPSSPTEAKASPTPAGVIWISVFA
jgi:hypothetical protein